MIDDDDRQWSDLAEIWQAQARPVDVAVMRAKIRARARKVNWLFALDMVQALLAFASAAVLLPRWTWPSNLVGFSLVVFGALAFGLAIWTRFPVNDTAVTSARRAFETSVRQARQGIRLAITGYCVTTAHFLLIGLLGYAHSQPSYHRIVPFSFWTKTLVVGVLLMLWVWRCHRLFRESRSDLNGLLALEDELFPDSPPIGRAD